MVNAHTKADGPIAARPPASAAAIAALSFFAVFAAAWLCVQRLTPTGGFAPVWFANAIAITTLTSPRRRAVVPWAAGAFAAILLANLVSGYRLASSAGYAFANAAEIAFVTAMLRGMKLDLRRPRDLAQFTAIAVIAASVSCLLAALIAHLLGFGGFGTLAASWLLSDFLGLIIVVPVLTTLIRLRGAIEWRRAREAVPELLVIMAALVAGFLWPSVAILLVITPALAFVAFRRGFGGAAIAITALTVVTIPATMLGYGPISTIEGTIGERLTLLQVLLAANTLTLFPIASVLAQRAGFARALARGERLQRVMNDNSSDLIMRIARDGRLIYVSQASRRLLGVPPDELVGRYWTDRIHPADMAGVMMAREQLREPGDEATSLYRFEQDDGGWIWLEARCRMIDAGEDDAEIVASIRNVSASRRAEERAASAIAELRESNRLLNLAEQVTRIGHWRADIGTDSVIWSDELYAILGVPRDTVPSAATIAALIHPDDRARRTAAQASTYRAGTPFRYQARVVRPDGETRWILSIGQAERGAGGQVAALFGVIQDVTEQVEANAEIAAARDAAEQALAVKSDFTATMSHEIRTPLTGVLTAVGLLRDATSEQDRERYLSSLDTSVKLLAAIVDDVLAFSRLEDGNVELERVAFEVAALVREVGDAFTGEAAAKGLVLECAVPETAAMAVLGDPARLKRVLANLLSNAIKFTGEGSVSLVAAQTGERWRFVVSDTGIGIEADKLEAIFTPYAQSDASTSRRFGGTGLGLAICRRLAEAMGGTVTVESLPGEGSAFTVEVPLPPAKADRSVVAQPEHLPATRPLTILLAEDNETNRYLFAELIRGAGHTVLTAADGAEAIAAAEREGAALDLILMDVSMPVVDGIAATRAIRALPGSVARAPIYAITADARPERRQVFLAAGMDGVLEKPLRVKLLAGVLAGAADRMIDTGAAETGKTADDAPVDVTRVEALARDLGRETRDEWLRLLADEAAAAPDRFDALAVSNKIDELRRAAHGLRGAALGAGATRLAAAAEAIEYAPTDDMADTALLAEVRAAAGAVAALAREMLQR